MKIRLGLIDDQVLFLKSLSVLLGTMQEIEVVLEATDGEALKNKLLSIETLPDILLVDVNMPDLNGKQVATWVKDKFPSIHLVALSTMDEDMEIIQMINAGCCAYLLKDIYPDELETALKTIKEKGFYNSDVRHRNYARLITGAQQKQPLKLNETEMQFLQLACSDLPYKKIASIMNKAERTVDGYREVLFNKLNVQSRVGMVLEAVRLKLVTI